MITIKNVKRMLLGVGDVCNGSLQECLYGNTVFTGFEERSCNFFPDLLLTRPFHWQPFLGYADINNASGIDISKQSDNSSAETADASDDDLQLVWTSDILSRLYDRYYIKASTVDDDPDYITVPSILRQMRKEVLGGDSRKTNIVLSGVIPINIQELAEEKGGFKRPPLIR